MRAQRTGLLPARLAGWSVTLLLITGAARADEGHINEAPPEIGVTPWEPLTLTAAALRHELDREKVHVGAGGTTEPGETTARVGVELGALFHLGRLYAEAHVMLNGAELVANSLDPDVAVSAPARIITGGLVWRFDDASVGAIRLRHESPAREEAFTIVEAELGQRIGPIALTVNVQNNEPEDLGPPITVRGTIAADF